MEEVYQITSALKYMPYAEVDGSHMPDDAELARRDYRPDLAPDPALPDDTRLWAALQNASGPVERIGLRR